MSYLQYFFPTRVFNGIPMTQWFIKSPTNMLFSPYFPIRFKGVFMAYLYIPQIFPIGFFEESQLTAILISRKIRSRGSVMKWCLSIDTSSTTNRCLFTERSHPSSTRLVDRIRQFTPKGHVLWEQSCPFVTPLHLYKYVSEINESNSCSKSLVHLHSLLTEILDVQEFWEDS